MRDQPTEDVKSLAGKIDKQAMGQHASRAKPLQKPKAGKKREEDEQPVFRAVRDDEITRINKKILDLHIFDVEDRTASKQEYKFKLPPGAEKIERVGYE